MGTTWEQEMVRSVAGKSNPGQIRPLLPKPESAGNYLAILLQCRFRFSRSRVGPETVSNWLPGGADGAL